MNRAPIVALIIIASLIAAIFSARADDARWSFDGTWLGASVTSPPGNHALCKAYAVILRDKGAVGDCQKWPVAQPVVAEPAPVVEAKPQPEQKPAAVTHYSHRAARHHHSRYARFRSWWWCRYGRSAAFARAAAYTRALRNPALAGYYRAMAMSHHYPVADTDFAPPYAGVRE